MRQIVLTVKIRVMTMSENTPEDVLDFYGKEIPVGIGEQAYTDPNREHVVKLRAVGKHKLDDEPYVFTDVSDENGVLATDGHPMVDDVCYWALPDDIVTTCVARLVKTTDLVVVDGEEEYLPPLVSDDDDEDNSGVMNPWEAWATMDEKV
jgi:hypothetical protein